jgi:hypothetical protein
MRRIVTTNLQVAGAGDKNIDTYFDRVLKYIPADIVSAWVAAKGIITASSADSKQTIFWVCFLIGVILTFIWTANQTRVSGKPARTQTLVATGAFVIWSIALGEPFTTAMGAANQALYGSLLLILYTLIVGMIVPNDKG